MTIHRRNLFTRHLLACAAVLGAAGGFAARVLAQAPAQATIDTAKLEDEAVQRTTDYIRLNTTNPPGNEVLTMRFLARILQQEGIPFDTALSAPGRGNIWARLKGGSKPALVLLHHMDVVPADPKYWDADPFAATLKNGEIWGRGTLDTKTLGILELESFLALHRAHVPLDRDVIFMATADEEAGGIYGAQWVVQHHPEAFRGAGFVINEGGSGSIDGTNRSFSIEVTQKTPFWPARVVGQSPDPRAVPPADVRVRTARGARRRDVLRGDRAAGVGEMEGQTGQPRDADRRPQHAH
jgi:hypothetical protein